MGVQEIYLDVYIILFIDDILVIHGGRVIMSKFKDCAPDFSISVIYAMFSK